MKQIRIIFYSLSLVFSFNSFSQVELFPDSISHMEKGLSATEELFEFLSARPCEIGLVKNCDKPLSGQDILLLKNLLRDLQSWKKDTFDYYVPNLGLLSNSFELKAGDAHNIKITKRLNPQTFRLEDHLKITYNPHDVESLKFAQEIRISSGMTLLLYDSFFQLAQILSKAKKLRSILEYDMPDEGQVLHETYALVMDKNLWARLVNGLDFVREEEKLRGSVPQAESVKYFEQYIGKSFTGSKIEGNDFIFRIQSVLFMDRVVSQARFFEAIDKIVARISQIFGNTAGQVQTRDGKLKVLASKPEVMQEMKNILKPLDILFEKTPFRLTDKFIPGYYGHVAIWLGRPEQLISMTVNYQGEEIPLLDHPVVLPYLERMSKGELVVEALREPGVTMNTLEHFMDIDDLLVLKPFEIEAEGEHVLRTLMQVGKPYDFNFDVETERAIVCSELVYTVFHSYNWPTSRSMGRYTISPDHVAWKAVDSCFEPTIMYQDGVEVKSDKKNALKRLLELPGGISYNPVGNCL